MASTPILKALLALRLAGPGLLVLLTSTLTFLRPSSPEHDHDSPIVSVIVSRKTPRRALILSFLSLCAAAYFLDGVLVVARAILTGFWEGSSPQWRFIEVADVLGLIAFAGLAALGTWKDVNRVEVWTRRRIKCFGVLALAVDIAQLVLLSLSVNLIKDPPAETPGKYPLGRFNIPNTLHFALVILRVLFLLVFVPALYFPRTSYVPAARNVASEDVTDEATTLVVPASSLQYGTFTPSPQTPFNITRTHSPAPFDGAPSSANPQVNPPAAAPAPLKPDPRKEVSEDPSWSEVGQRLRKLTPYLWPKKDRGLQILALICVILLVIGRIVNLLLPLTLGRLVYVLQERVNPKDGLPPASPWPSLLLYVVLRFLQSPGGLPALRDTLWAPVMQYSDREMSQLSFDHLLNLSLAFHTRRKTGEILRILDRGAAINHILELLLFNIAPTFFDILIALIFFYVTFTFSLALVILAVMVAYMWASVVLTKLRTKIRRRMNDRDVITRGIHTDCLLNYETVKYFGGEQHEARRYQDAIREYQALEYRVMVSLNLLNLVQNFIFSLGILVGSLIVASQITNGLKAGSDFVIFITYLAQLYGPLNSLGYIYRSINQNLVDTERLMKLLDEPAEVNDKPGAEELHVEAGEIEFQNVNFSYDGRTTALNGVSFKVPKNSSVALVGESGSGKSTVLRLLYRFYDLKEGEGRILIDGHDIRDVTQNSLRKAIGVVPQDSVLFNSSIGYNIGYGKFGATPEEIEMAAKAAQMHERIVSFPDGYETKVGERGVRLSGGEKQRVAIARTLLKNPPILLLDEATSALDTSTEKDIQKALQNLVKGRSSLSIAHRLSTIANADIILVLKEGQIVEKGTFRELLAFNGIFASMWADQVSADDELIDRSSMQKEGVSGYNLIELDTKTEVAPAQPQQTVIDYASPEPQNPFADPTNIVDLSDDFIPTDSPVGETASVEQPQDIQRTDEEILKLYPEETPKTYPEDTPKPYPEDGQPKSDPDDTSASIEPSAEATPGPVVLPASERPLTPVGFPSSPQSEIPSSPGVTFGAGVDSPPSRSGTPDPEGKPKRTRKTSQNIQKFARSLSLVTRRQSSASNIPKLDTSSPRTSREDSRGEGSVGGESTEASIGGDDKKEGKGKGKKARKSLSRSSK